MNTANTKAIRIWWEELADQYEEYADNPPMQPAGGYERYTCCALERTGFGEVFWLWQVWQYCYKNRLHPIGFYFGPDRAEKREEFCLWMADTIREYLETGKGPWETE